MQTFYQEQAKNSTIDLEKAIKVAFDLEERYEISQLEGYKKLEPNSMFRESVFYKQIPLHREYHENRKRNQRNQKTMEKIKKGALIVGTAAVLFIAVKHHGKISSLFGGEM